MSRIDPAAGPTNRWARTGPRLGFPSWGGFTSPEIRREKFWLKYNQISKVQVRLLETHNLKTDDSDNKHDGSGCKKGWMEVAQNHWLCHSMAEAIISEHHPVDDNGNACGTSILGIVHTYINIFLTYALTHAFFLEGRQSLKWLSQSNPIPRVQSMVFHRGLHPWNSNTVFCLLHW